MNIILKQEMLQERVKEFACLHEISKIISKSLSIEKKILKKIIASTKRLWYHRDLAIVNLRLRIQYIIIKIRYSSNLSISKIHISNADAEDQGHGIPDDIKNNLNLF